MRKMSLEDYKKRVESGLTSNEEVLKELGWNRGETLNFEDALVLFYYNKHAIPILRCDACRELILGPSFSCFECLSNSYCNRHTLCCDCYGGGKSIHHNHPLSSTPTATPLLHDQHLLVKFSRLTTAKGVSGSGKADGIGSVARAYYERASDDEKNKAKEFFGRFDLNGDGNVSITELKRAGYDSTRLNGVFQKLDSNGEGALNFFDVLVVFYCRDKPEILGLIHCDGCDEMQLGPYFSCTLCLSRFPNTYDLCCDCYRGGNVEHNHPFSNFSHNQALLRRLMRQCQANAQTTGEMEELQKVAKLQYRAASPEVQKLATDFFKSMDTDGDEQVDVEEFLSFMTQQQGCGQLRNRQSFKQFDVNGNGSLDFWEVMTLYYVIKSGRPNCDRCGDLIPGIFFSCVFCFKAGSSFSLCRACYQSPDFIHNHNGKTQFLDNYTLLETIRESSVAHDDQSRTEPSSQTAIARPTGKTNKDVAYKALELAIATITTFGNIAANQCTIL